MPDVVSFILVLAIAAALLYLGSAYLMARSLLRPPRMTDAKANWVLKRLSPQDLGMEYERLTFDVRDVRTGNALRLAAWWIASPQSRQTVVLVHGYADAKVGAIAWAPLFHSLGFNILALDLRAHGESEGTLTTAGYYERHDLNEVINRLRAERPGETERLILFGASMGAAVVCAAAVERDDLDGIILESPFADFRHAVMAHFELIGAPGRRVQRLALRMARWISGAHFEEIRPIDLLPQLNCPLLLIQSGDDPFLTDADEAAIAAALQQRRDLGRETEHYRLDDVPHLMGIVQRPEEYRQRMTAFIEHQIPHPPLRKPVH